MALTDPDDPSAGLRRVIENTLPYVVVQVCAVVVCFDGGTSGVVGVGVEGVEVRADAFYGREVLEVSGQGNVMG